MSHPTDPPTTPLTTPPSASAVPDPALAAAQAELATLRASLDASERRRALDRALLEAGAIDPESAAIVAASLPDAPTTGPGALVADLKRRKPFLFTHPRPATSFSAPVSQDPGPAEAAATHARTTGDRRSLLHYLRLRRQPPA
jgi:hypothetical protein